MIWFISSSDSARLCDLDFIIKFEEEEGKKTLIHAGEAVKNNVIDDL